MKDRYIQISTIGIVGAFFGIVMISLLSSALIPVMAPVASCAGITINSTEVTSIPFYADDQLSGTKISLSVVVPSPGKENESVDVIFIGPILGSMDDSKIEPTVSCEFGMITLSVRVTRSDYRGAALQNIFWRPHVTVSLSVDRTHKTLTLIGNWILRSSAGEAITGDLNIHDQRFPITVTKSFDLHN